MWEKCTMINPENNNVVAPFENAEIYTVTEEGELHGQRGARARKNLLPGARIAFLTRTVTHSAQTPVTEFDIQRTQHSSYRADARCPAACVNDAYGYDVPNTERIGRHNVTLQITGRARQLYYKVKRPIRKGEPILANYLSYTPRT
jgi:hypothetical protein